MSLISNAESSVTFKMATWPSVSWLSQSLLMALMCPPHSFGYFGINAAKTKTPIEDNHAAAAFIDHGKKLKVEDVAQRFGLLLDL